MDKEVRAGKRRIAIGTAPIPPVGYVDLKFNAMKGSPPSRAFGRIQLAKLVRPCNIREGQGIYPSSLTQRPLASFQVWQVRHPFNLTSAFNRSKSIFFINFH